MYDTLKKNLVKDKKYNKYYLFKPYTNENCFAFSPKVIVLLEFHKLVFTNMKTALLTTDHEKNIAGSLVSQMFIKNNLFMPLPFSCKLMLQIVIKVTKRWKIAKSCVLL